MEVLAELLLVLVLARGLGELTERLGLQTSTGEVLAGSLVGYFAVHLAGSSPFFNNLARGTVLEATANVAIFVLILHAAVEMKPEVLAARTRSSLFIALGGVALPLITGLLLGELLLPESPVKQAQTLLIGVALSISAIAASVKILADQHLEHHPVGETIIYAAVIDDVLGLFLLAILLAVINTGLAPDIGPLVWLMIKIATFFAITIMLGRHVYPRIHKTLSVMQATSVEFSFLVAVAMGYGLLAEILGMHWILGAFMAGLYYEPDRVTMKAYMETRLMLTAATRGLLGPLFFAYIGLSVDLRAFVDVPGFLMLVLLVAFLGKLIGAGLPAWGNGFSLREAAAVGAGLSSRGGVELVIVAIAHDAGLFNPGPWSTPVTDNLFSVLIIVAVLTTIAAPIALKWLMEPKDWEGDWGK